MADKEKDQEKANKDHRSDEMNPNNPACQARMDHQANQGNRDSEAFQAVRDNRANQLNPKHHEYKGGRQDDQDDETVPKTEAQWLCGRCWRVSTNTHQKLIGVVLSVKACPHCRRKVQLLQKSATVAEFGDCRTFLRQCGPCVFSVI